MEPLPLIFNPGVYGFRHNFSEQEDHYFWSYFSLSAAEFSLKNFNKGLCR